MYRYLRRSPACSEIPPARAKSAYLDLAQRALQIYIATVTISPNNIVVACFINSAVTCPPGLETFVKRNISMPIGEGTGASAAKSPAIALAENRLEDTLQDGEVVVLAIKPSGWFVWMVSWQVVVGAGVVAGLTALLDRFAGAVPQRTIYIVCVSAGAIRVGVGCFQWLGRLYVLTNLRVIRIGGVPGSNVCHCLLKNIARTLPAATRGERLLGVGSVFFRTARQGPGETPSHQTGWVHVSNHREVDRIINEAIRRAGKRGQ